MSKTTVGELRQALTQIDNQKMTVEELRRLLYEYENQDEELEYRTLATIERKAKQLEAKHD